VEPTRLYRQIADQIAALIASGEFRKGERLPAERELATLLGVSRTSVREAIICLELSGSVEVRVGTGIFVTGATAPARGAPPARLAPAVAEEPGPFELLAARRLIEGEIAALAARSIRRRDIAALRETLRRMREHAEDFETRDAADREFHTRIAAATGNGALASVVDQMWAQRRGDLWTRMESHFHTGDLHRRTLDDHAAIVAALEAHDQDGAKAAMHRHIDRVAREFQRRWEAGGASAAGH